jgi:hypothetical protein
MPIESSIDTKRGLSIHNCTGTVTADDILQAINALYAGAGYTHSYHSIWDFRDCAPNLSSDEMRRIIDFERKNEGPDGGKVALVVNQTLNFGLARMYHMLSEQRLNRSLQVFRDYDDAFIWISGLRNK